MAENECLEILKAGVKAWNSWRRSATVLARHPDLSLADLSSVNLPRVDLTNADLSFARMSNARLPAAKLSGARMIQTDLRGADLRWAKLNRAIAKETDFESADLSESYLDEIVLVNARLPHADITLSSLSRAFISGTDLSTCIGVERVSHRGPSALSIDMISGPTRPPDAFLRGCGVPEPLITYIPSLFTSPIEFYSCFISYSSKDQSFAERLYEALQAERVRCWFAPHHLKGGRKLHEQIRHAIYVHDKVLIVLSESSMNSEWVRTEIANAREREMQEGRRILFPLTLAPFEVIRRWQCFDADIGKDSAREIREYYIPDFTGWTDDHCFRVAFNQLLRGLRDEDVGV